MITYEASAFKELNPGTANILAREVLTPLEAVASFNLVWNLGIQGYGPSRQFR
jgi:hypothetical protein